MFIVTVGGDLLTVTARQQISLPLTGPFTGLTAYRVLTAYRTNFLVDTKSTPNRPKIDARSYRNPPNPI